jgi:hypothetical protein
MTIQITKTETKDIEVPVPSFWKGDSSYTAVVDEQTAIHLFIGRDYLSIQHGTPEEMKGRIEMAHKCDHLCTETEFMEAYNKTLKSLSLQPELV